MPSLDLVVVRLGYGPQNWGEESLLPAVMAAVVDSLQAGKSLKRQSF
jgi:hypothetical protein